MNKYLLLLIFTLVLPITAHAQFFDFGFGDPFDDFFGPHRVEQQQPVEKAQFKGGVQGMNDFIEKNYKNPSPRIQGLEGEIMVLCVISESCEEDEVQACQTRQEESQEPLPDRLSHPQGPPLLQHLANSGCLSTAPPPWKGGAPNLNACDEKP